MSNYMIPPRSKPSDLTKGKITQDEIIALQIANDANIAKARKALASGEIQPLSQIEALSPEELIADDAQQEASAFSVLKRLGFRDQEISTIINEIRQDPDLTFTSLTTNAPTIEDDVRRRFNVRLLTPSFFIEYLRSYTSDLNDAQGVRIGRVFNSSGGSQLNHLVNTVAELRRVLPTRDDVGSVYDLVRRNGVLMGQIGDDTVDRLRVIEALIPSPVDYQRLEALGAVERQRIISDIQQALGDLPDRADIAEVIRSVRENREDAVDRLDALANSIDDQTIEFMDELRREIQATEQSIKRGMRQGEQRQRAGTEAEIEAPMGGASRGRASEVSDITGTTAETTSTLGSSIALESATLAEIKATFRANPDLARRLIDNNTGEPLDFERLQKKPTGAFYQGDKVFIGDTNANEIFRAKFGRGMGRSVHMKTRSYRLKVGRGVAVQQLPSYREFGKYAINAPQLEHYDVLNIRYKSGGSVPKFSKAVPVSDVFRDFVLDLLDGSKANQRVYSQIPEEERKLFEEVSLGAGVWGSLGLQKTTTSNEKEEAKRFELLRGQYIAGNNSPKVLEELRRLVVKMINDGRIGKAQGLDLLVELSV